VRARVADDPAMGDALDVVERCLYGGTPVPTGVRLAASETLDRHTARMLAAADLEAAAAPASS
jgi:Flp pilus assembly protein TadB